MTTCSKSTKHDFPFLPEPVYILKAWLSWVPIKTDARCSHIYPHNSWFASGFVSSWLQFSRAFRFSPGVVPMQSRSGQPPSTFSHSSQDKIVYIVCVLASVVSSSSSRYVIRRHNWYDSFFFTPIGGSPLGWYITVIHFE